MATNVARYFVIGTLDYRSDISSRRNAFKKLRKSKLKTSAESKRESELVRYDESMKKR